MDVTSVISKLIHGTEIQFMYIVNVLDLVVGYLLILLFQICLLFCCCFFYWYDFIAYFCKRDFFFNKNTVENLSFFLKALFTRYCYDDN